MGDQVDSVFTNLAPGASEPASRGRRIDIDSDGILTLDGRPVKVVINGCATRRVRIGCHTVSFEAMERLYAVYRRHRDLVEYTVQKGVS